MARPAAIPKLTEAQLERQCSDLLALDGWRSLKTDPVSRKEWGKGFGEKGMADRLYIRYSGRYSDDPLCLAGSPASRADAITPARVMWIEWKTTTGRAEAHQIAWHTAERSRGALVLLAGIDFPATLEGFTGWYRSSGLMRRQL